MNGIEITNQINRMNEQIYLGGEYQIVSSDMYFFEKYTAALPKFVLENTAEEVLGHDWKNKDYKDAKDVIHNFITRMKKKDLDLDSINEPVLFGFVIDKGSIHRFPELVLLREIIFNHSLAEFDQLKKTNKIKIKSLTN